LKNKEKRFEIAEVIISPSTVQKWEQGNKNPTGASLKLLDIIERKGIDTLL